MTSHPTILPRLLLISCAVIWGWTFVATRICLQYVTPFELLGLRLIIALPVLLILVRVKRARALFTRAEKIRLLLAGSIITAHFLIQITGLKYTTATNTGWLIAVCPLAMAALAFLILKERLSRRFIWGIVIATSGIVVLISGGNVTELDWLSAVGDWLILLSAFTWALFTICVRDLTRAHNPLVITTAVFLPTAIVIPAVMFFTTDWNAILSMPLESWLALLFLGVLGSGIAHWFWQIGVAKLGAAKAGMYLYLEPLAATALAVPYLGESFGWATAVGGALVLAGVYYAEFRKTRRI